MKRLFKRIARKCGFAIGSSRQGGRGSTLDRVPPPPTPSGLDSGPPDFVGIGTQRSGTSWWFGLIAHHPAVFTPRFPATPERPAYLAKERHFFDRFFADEFSPADVKAYWRWFPRPRGMRTGEWTPRYMVDYWVPPLMQIAAPDTKLLVLLRNPVDRYASGLAHTRRTEPENPGWAVEQMARGFYSRQLARWLELFDRDQILVLQFERCRLDPARHLRATWEFLGLDPSESLPSGETLSAKVNATRKGREFTIPTHHRETLVRLYSEDVQQLLTAFPDAIDVGLWPQFN